MEQLDTLAPFPTNPRTHSPEQVERIANSIREFGFTNPVLVDGKRGVIAGHGRIEAARSLGMETVPVVELGHLSEAQKRAYIIADNRLALDGGWDTDLLLGEFAALDLAGFDLGFTGFTGDEIEAFRAPEFDPAEAWQGMPEFEQPDATAFKTLAVHFKDQAAVDQFARMIGQRIGEKTRFTWFPQEEEARYIDKAYVTNG